MKTRRIYSARGALPRAMAAVLALLFCELAAGLPGVPESLGLGLAILGYVSFVLLIQSALLSWRRDWEGLWRANLDRRPISSVVSFSKRKHWTAAS